jgi:hypothetical protein
MSEVWPQYYILLDRTPIAVDVMTWAKWFENIENRRIARTEINDRCYVSTVFLGLDHNFSGRGDPVLFESMVFGGPLDQEQRRYRSYAEAEEGHQAMLTRAKIAAAQIKSIHDKAHT